MSAHDLPTPDRAAPERAVAVSAIPTPAPASVPRHVLARWQSQCGGTSHHTHRGAVQERGWTFDPTHHGTVQGPTGRMAFFIRNGGMMRRSI